MQEPTKEHDAKAIARASLVLCICAIGVALLFVLYSLSNVEKLTRVFEDFDTELPSLTIFFASFPPIVVGAGALMSICLLILKERVIQSKETCLYINTGTFLISLITFGIYREAMLRPLLILFESVSGG